MRDKFFDGRVRDPALVGRSQERPHSRNVGKPAGDDEVVPGGVLRLASLAQLFAVRLHIARRVLVILDRLEGALDVARAGRPGIVHLRPRGQLLGQQRGVVCRRRSLVRCSLVYLITMCYGSAVLQATCDPYE